MAADPLSNPNTAATVKRSAGQVSTLLQGEMVILNVNSGKYYNLNPVGSRIWELIEQPATILAIVDAITAEYDVDRERCAADVSRIVQSMQSAGLVDVADGASTGPSDAG